MEVGLSCENIKQLIVGKEAVEEKTEKAITDLECRWTFLLFWFMVLIGVYSIC